MKKKFLAKIRELLTQNARPHSVAAGAAIGIFYGFLPFFGLKTLLSYLTSLALKVNTPAAIIGVTLHDLSLPFLPVLLRVEYQIGYWILSNPHHFAPRIRHSSLNLDAFHHWDKFLALGAPILVGSIVVGTVSACVTYYFLHMILHERKRRLANNPPVKNAD